MRGTALRVLAVVVLCWHSTVLWALTDHFTFEQPGQQQQFQRLLKELRCLVCQNQSLADSDAVLAEDLRNTVYQQVQAQRSDAAIKAYLVTRYGNFILYRPPWQKRTWLLWGGPVALLLIGVLLVVLFSWRLRAGGKR